MLCTSKLLLVLSIFCNYIILTTDPSIKTSCCRDNVVCVLFIYIKPKKKKKEMSLMGDVLIKISVTLNMATSRHPIEEWSDQ